MTRVRTVVSLIGKASSHYQVLTRAEFSLGYLTSDNCRILLENDARTIWQCYNEDPRGIADV